ncbi:hypothetical protein ABWI14_26675, partial [Streptomyces capoamus]
MVHVPGLPPPYAAHLSDSGIRTHAGQTGDSPARCARWRDRRPRADHAQEVAVELVAGGLRLDLGESGESAGRRVVDQHV